MDIKSSLIIEDNNQGKINLILSSSFVRVYNRSFYLLSEVLGRRLKPEARHIKRAHNRFVVSGGFPHHKVAKDYPNAIKTQWGFQIIGKFNLTDYKSWLLTHELSSKAVNNVGTIVATSCTQGVQGDATKFSTKIIQHVDNVNLKLEQ